MEGCERLVLAEADCGLWAEVVVQGTLHLLLCWQLVLRTGHAEAELAGCMEGSRMGFVHGCLEDVVAAVDRSMGHSRSSALDGGR